MLAITKKTGGSSKRPPYNPMRPPSDRKPSGDRVQGVSPTVFFRMREHGVRLGLDPRLGTVLGRMGLFKELSEAEVDAGFRIAEIYGRYEMLQGIPRRAAASPSYQRGFGAKDAIDTERMLPDELKRYKKAVRRATKAFDQVQNWIGNEHALIEQVCVLNEEPGPTRKGMVACVLHSVAIHMGLIAETRAVPREKGPTKDDATLFAEAAVDALVHWFVDRASKPTHFSLVTNPDWKKSRGLTGSDGRYHHTIPIPLRGLPAAELDAKLRLICAVHGMIEIDDAETGEVA